MPDGIHLTELAQEANPTVWMHGEGSDASCVISLGEYARFHASGPTRFADLAEQFSKFCQDLPVRASGLRAFVTTTFSPTSPADSVLIVPREQWQFLPGNTRHITLGEPESCHPNPPGAFGRQISARTAGMLPQEQYRQAVMKAVERIRAGELEKTVLARSETLTLDGPVPIGLLCASLHETYRSCWTFYVDGMLGASPEMLVSVRDGRLHSRALAGSAPVTGNKASDDKAAALLLASAKDRSEHAYAADSVVEVLQTVADVDVSDTRVVRLPTIMHLATDVTGELRQEYSALHIAGMLHPSAAICGTPKAAAARVLGELEGEDRGRYSAPVGWIDDGGNGEFVIALRCAKIDGRDLTLYAGAGIVAESDPGKEYAETEVKMLPILRAVAALEESLR